MTKKHFTALADILKESKPNTYDSTEVWDKWTELYVKIGKFCREENPNFDPDLFEEYVFSNKN